MERSTRDGKRCRATVLRANHESGKNLENCLFVVQII